MFSKLLSLNVCYQHERPLQLLHMKMLKTVAGMKGSKQTKNGYIPPPSTHNIVSEWHFPFQCVLRSSVPWYEGIAA